MRGSSLPRNADQVPAATLADGGVANALAARLAGLFGVAVVGVLHYGSRAQGRVGRGPTADSPFDFFLVVDGYRGAYRALAAGGAVHHRTGLATVLSAVLPPNAISIRFPAGPGGGAEGKCLVIALRHLRRECGARARDHFVRARLMQHVVPLWWRDERSLGELNTAVTAARLAAFGWARPFLPPRFDAETFCRTLLEVSFASELRLEARGHAAALFDAQRELLLAVHGPLLASLADRGVLARDGASFRLAGPVGAPARWRARIWFGWSKVRTTLRLLKHPFLYDDWLGYLERKVARSTGRRVELTERERRHPLIYLWPRAIRHLRSRPQLNERQP